MSYARPSLMLVAGSLLLGSVAAQARVHAVETGFEAAALHPATTR